LGRSFPWKPREWGTEACAQSNLKGISNGPNTHENSLFEIDRELDGLLDNIQEEIEIRGEASVALMDRFQQFCEAHTEKVDRIGRFLRMMEARVQFCRSEAARLQDRARISDRKIEQTKNMVLYYLKSRELKKIEGQEFTLRLQKNSQDSVRITDETRLPVRFRRVEALVDGELWEKIIAALSQELRLPLVASIRGASCDHEAIKAAAGRAEVVPGAEVYRGDHLRVA
jgi:hypothetical protein